MENVDTWQEESKVVKGKSCIEREEKRVKGRENFLVKIRATLVELEESSASRNLGHLGEIFNISKARSVPTKFLGYV